MEPFKINCLTDCLKCNCDGNCCPHTMHSKRGKKFITLVKNSYQMRSFKNTKTNEFLPLDRTQV